MFAVVLLPPKVTPPSELVHNPVPNTGVLVVIALVVKSHNSIFAPVAALISLKISTSSE